MDGGSLPVHHYYRQQIRMYMYRGYPGHNHLNHQNKTIRLEKEMRVKSRE